MIKTFPKGGVHPPDQKLTRDQSIRVFSLPDKVVIPLAQHIGAPATPCVQTGDRVKTGQLIARGSGFVSANIHASVSGTITKIDSFPDASGYKKNAFLIEREGDEWMEDIDRSDHLSETLDISREEIIARITEAGIVGLGGATFPSHVKTAIPQGKSCNILVINGAECEPYLTCDHRLMMEKGPEILVGIRILMKALSAKRTKIGIEENKMEALLHLSQLAKKHPEIRVIPLKTKYPQGGEKQLIHALTGKQVPQGKIPLDVGIVPFNIGTVFAIYEAVQKKKPLFERVITITGKSLQQRENFLVRIGTPLAEIMEACGGVPPDTGKIILGGPMMGKAVASLNVPLTKGCSGIVLMDESTSCRKSPTPCIRCAQCVSVCPMGLEPYLLSRLSELGLQEKAVAEDITLCIECGSCSYICPADRHLLDWIRVGKNIAIKNARSLKK